MRACNMSCLKRSRVPDCAKKSKSLKQTWQGGNVLLLRCARETSSDQTSRRRDLIISLEHQFARVTSSRCGEARPGPLPARAQRYLKRRGSSAFTRRNSPPPHRGAQGMRHDECSLAVIVHFVSLGSRLAVACDAMIAYRADCWPMDF